jgi:beta-glucanase (GH16 family)
MRRRATMPFIYVLWGATVVSAQTTQPATLPTAAPEPTADHYKLVWADEFNVAGPLNPKDWTAEKGFVRNRELQWYQEENARCANGCLVIEARRENPPKPNPNYNPNGRDWKTTRKTIEYTSASMTTRRLHEFTYGRFEIKARIDTRAGSWPAFWTLGIGPWPHAGEVDVMEYYKETLLANIAWQGPTRIFWNSKRTPISTFGEGWSTQFHVWMMDWNERFIGLYVDGKLINSQDLAKTVNASGPLAGQNPFQGKPMYILLNQAIAGDQGGDPAQTDFPVKYEIDYIRVYQAPAATTAPAASR